MTTAQEGASGDFAILPSVGSRKGCQAAFCRLKKRVSGDFAILPSPESLGCRPIFGDKLLPPSEKGEPKLGRRGMTQRLRTALGSPGRIKHRLDQHPRDPERRSLTALLQLRVNLSGKSARALEKSARERRRKGAPPQEKSARRPAIMPKKRSNSHQALADRSRCWVEAAGVDKRGKPHASIDASATVLLDGGAGLRDIQTFVGHEHVRIMPWHPRS